MSTLSALVIKNDGNALDLGANTAAGKAQRAALIASDPLGLIRESKLMEKQTEAITDPKKYISDRNKKIEDAQKEVYDNWMKLYQKKIIAGFTDAQARVEADTVAMGEWRGRQAAIDLEYPLSALGTALERKSFTNQKNFDEGKNIISEEKKVLAKRTYKKRSTRGKGKK